MDNNEFENINIDDEVVSQDTNISNNTMQNSVNSFEKIKNTKATVDRINDIRTSRINKNVNQNNNISNKKDYNVKDNLNVRNSYKDQSRNDNKFNDKIASSKAKSLFNKRGNLDGGEGNSLKDTIEKKAAGKGITAATGGLIHGKAAEKAGDIALKVQKKFLEKQKKKFYLIIGLSAGIVIFLIFIILIVAGDVDNSNTISDTGGYITGNMTDEELVNYLSYISICPNTETLKETYGDGDVIDIIKNHPDKLLSCQNAIDYYRAIKKEYSENGKACYRDKNENGEMLDNFYRNGGSESSLNSNPKAIAYFNGKHTIDYKSQVDSGNYDCQINLPNQLLLETMSLGYTDAELFDQDTLKSYTDKGLFDDYEVDFRKLTNAVSEFVHEACFMWETKYIDASEIAHGSPCNGCTIKKEKVAYDGYYFQTSYNKYVCYLKYGDTCNHPNYSGKPIEKNEDMEYFEHECVGPSNDVLTAQSTGENSTACESIGDDIEACNNRSDCEVKDNVCSSKESSDEDYSVNNGIVSGNGQSVVDYALKFVGNKYVYGGTSLTNGIDCSGFTMQIFKKFGVNLPHSSAAQRLAGNEVSSLAEAKPGDIICYYGHVAIYMGNNQIVHAASSKSGIKISNNAAYRKIATIRRLVG